MIRKVLLPGLFSITAVLFIALYAYAAEVTERTAQTTSASATPTGSGNVSVSAYHINGVDVSGSGTVAVNRGRVHQILGQATKTHMNENINTSSPGWHIEGYESWSFTGIPTGQQTFMGTSTVDAQSGSNSTQYTQN